MNLIEILENKGFSSKTIAEKLNISLAYLSMIRTGKRPISKLLELKIKQMLIQDVDETEDVLTNANSLEIKDYKKVINNIEERLKHLEKLMTMIYNQNISTQQIIIDSLNKSQ